MRTVLSCLRLKWRPRVRADENQTGTGAFLFDEYVIGTYMKFTRNPNYWKTWTYEGQEYELPFLDEIVLPIIPDESTQISALRTGKLDIHHSVKPEYWDSLSSTAPGILQDYVEGIGGGMLMLNCSEPPFDDPAVRRAMTIATDIAAFNSIWAPGAEHIDWYPVYQGDPTVYTPLADLPESMQTLYDYNPTLAQQMLADAGYPNGFTVDLTTRAIPEFEDPSALVADQWAKVGVTVNIRPYSQVEFSGQLGDKTYSGVMIEGLSVSNPVDTLLRKGETGGPFNYALWRNDRFNSLMQSARVEQDYAVQAANMKEAALLLREEAPYIPLYTQMWGFAWWPWLKGYNGEFSYSDGGMGSQYAYLWIDEDLKAEMGY
jgi:peptide/nickel transport system substrate-binding protein